MTVVLRGFHVSSTNKPYSFLMGDLLISAKSEIAGDWERELPTTETPWKHIEHDSKWWPVGLTQKLVVVSPNLALGWAGSHAMARYVIAAIMREHGASPQTKEAMTAEIDRLCREYHASGLAHSPAEGLDVIGFLHDDRFVTAFSVAHGRMFTHMPFKDVAVIGTGSETVPKLVRDLKADSPSKAIMGEGHDALRELIELAGLLLNEEVNSSDLRDLYGGGYEIVTLGHQGFLKNDDVLYVFWRAFVSEEGELTIHMPFRACRFTYHEDLLLAHVARFSRETGWSRVFVVPPVYRDLSAHENEGPLPSMNARVICHSFFVYYAGSPLFTYIVTSVKEHAEENKYVYFKRQDERSSTLEIDIDFVRQMHEWLLATWRNRPKERG